MSPPPVTLRDDYTLADLRFVCANLRERDRAEIFATRFDDDPYNFAEDIFAVAPPGGMAWVAYLGNEPVAFLGARPAWPGVWFVFAFGTDLWPRVVLSLTRQVRRFLAPALYNSGAQRVLCHALETHWDARRWLSCFGMQPESILPLWGKNGETFVLYAWRRFSTRRS